MRRQKKAPPAEVAVKPPEAADTVFIIIPSTDLKAYQSDGWVRVGATDVPLVEGDRLKDTVTEPRPDASDT